MAVLLLDTDRELFVAATWTMELECTGMQLLSEENYERYSCNML
jgi:hypothetical protein